MVSIQTVSTCKKRFIVAAALLLFAALPGCANKEQTAYRLAAQAQQLLEQGDVPGARLLIDQALRERDDLVELQILKGRIELAGKSLDAAYVSYYNALSMDPVNQDALQSVAMLGLQTGHTDEAESAAGKLLSLSPQNPTALLVRGLLALERKRFAEAVAAADRILANAPTDESAVILKTRALYLSDSQAQAKALVAQTIRLVGPSPGLARISLEIARAEGDSEAMLKAFGELRQQGQADPSIGFDEANTRYKIGDRAGASAIILSALKQDKAGPDLALRPIELWQEYDPTAPAAGSLNGITNPAVRQELARFLVSRGRFAEAAGLIASDDGAIGTAIRSRVLFGMAKPQQARQLAEGVIANDPAQCDARLTLANLALAAKNYSVAVTNAQQAASECPSELEGWLLQTSAYQASGQDIQAARVLRDAINRNPDSQRIHAAFTEWLMQSGRKDQATGVARHLVRYAPNRISTWQLLAKTCGGSDCSMEARIGLEKATASFVLDRRPGEPPRRGLFATMGGGGGR